MAWDNPKKRKRKRELKRAWRAKKAAKRAEEEEEAARMAGEEAERLAVEDAAGGVANLTAMMNEIQLVPQPQGTWRMTQRPPACDEIPCDDVPCLKCGAVDRPEDFLLCEGCDQGGHID